MTVIEVKSHCNGWKGPVVRIVRCQRTGSASETSRPESPLQWNCIIGRPRRGSFVESVCLGASIVDAMLRIVSFFRSRSIRELETSRLSLSRESTTPDKKRFP